MAASLFETYEYAVIPISVHIISEDYWGNRNILGIAGVGQTFSKSLACTDSAISPVDVIAETPVEVIFLDVRRVLTLCSSTCTFHARRYLIHLRRIRRFSLDFASFLHILDDNEVGCPPAS